jgi:hypothetical protein
MVEKDSMRIARERATLMAMASVTLPVILLVLVALATELVQVPLSMKTAMVFVMSAAAPVLKMDPECDMAEEHDNYFILSLKKSQ